MNKIPNEFLGRGIIGAILISVALYSLQVITATLDILEVFAWGCIIFMPLLIYFGIKHFNIVFRHLLLISFPLSFFIQIGFYPFLEAGLTPSGRSTFYEPNANENAFLLSLYYLFIQFVTFVFIWIIRLARLISRHLKKRKETM